MRRLTLPLAFFLGIYAGETPAQQLPDPMKSLLRRNEPVLSGDSLSQAETQFLWEKTTPNQAYGHDYLLVKTGQDYVHLIEDMRRFAKPDTPSSSLRHIVEAIEKKGYAYMGQLQEGGDRVTLVYGDRAGTLLMQTIWSYSKSGARVVQVDKFLNARVGDNGATLALAVAPPSDQALWKISWLNQGISYELYMSDKLLGGGVPKHSPAEIIDIANTTLDNVSSQPPS